MSFCWTGIAKARHLRRVAMLLAFLACWFAGSPSFAAAVIERVEVRGDRIVVRFDQAVADASTVIVDSPRRIALDVSGAAPGARTESGGPVAAIRQAPRGQGARIVFDLTRPAIVSEGKFGKDGRELTLELRNVDEAGFARAASERRLTFLPPFSWAQRAAGPAKTVTMAVPPSSRRLRLPRVSGGDNSRPLVVIDAGHGGHDPGAIGPDGRREKDVTLRIAKAIRSELEKSGRVRVALTRDDDRFLVLQERYGVARKLGASLFISIHCDSVGENSSATGASIYTLSEVASDKQAARLAARENKADIIGGVDLADAAEDVSSILIDLTQRETMNSSANFARLLGRESSELVPFKQNYHRMASLLVLRAPDMPSILFETGYISNPEDLAFIDSAEGRDRIAQGVRRAVEIHFARRLASN